MNDRIPKEMSQKILEYLRKKTDKNWEDIASLVGVTEKTLCRIKKGEVGLSFQQLLNLIESMGPDMLSTPEDATLELKELYRAYREVILE